MVKLYDRKIHRKAFRTSELATLTEYLHNATATWCADPRPQARAHIMASSYLGTTGIPEINAVDQKSQECGSNCIPLAFSRAFGVAETGSVPVLPTYTRIYRVVALPRYLAISGPTYSLSLATLLVIEATKRQPTADTTMSLPMHYGLDVHKLGIYFFNIPLCNTLARPLLARDTFGNPIKDPMALAPNLSIWSPTLSA